jgi:hypothetical protein
MKFAALFPIVAFTVLGCTPRGQSDTALREMPWKLEDVAQHKISLKSDHLVEYYEFGDNGFGKATIGGVGANGALMAPGVRWEIRDGKLVITTGNEEVLQVLTLLGRTEDEITVRTKGGVIERFNYRH